MQALVIDDSRMMRRLLCRLLSGCGFEAIEAENGVTALDLLASGPPPQLILVDWNMPEMTGIEFVGRVREEARYDQARVMMVTTESDTSRMVEALADGADEYLMKPFTKHAFEDKLRLLGFSIASTEEVDQR